MVGVMVAVVGHHVNGVTVAVWIFAVGRIFVINKQLDVKTGYVVCWLRHHRRADIVAGRRIDQTVGHINVRHHAVGPCVVRVGISHYALLIEYRLTTGVNISI